jgi:hypothetical protein
MTSALEFGVHMFTRCSKRFKITHFPAHLVGWASGGVCIFLEIDRAFELDFWKTTRRDRVRVFRNSKYLVEFEDGAGIRKKGSIHASIHRSLVSPTALILSIYAPMIYTAPCIMF